MNLIKNAIESKYDELAHKQFRRFSKGTFEKRAMLNIKKSKNVYSIKTTFEYLDCILLYAGEHFKGDVEVSGTITGSSDLLLKAKKYNLDGEPRSAMGAKKLQLFPAKISFSELKEMLYDFKDEFLLLSLKSSDLELISKENLPKHGKSKGEDSEKPDKIDFCKLKTTDAGLVKELLFDVNDIFKQAIVEHTFIIEDFEIPKEYENDATKARLMARRKGKIIRKLAIDGKLQEKTYSFSA